MHPVLRKTFGGLSAQYYLRQLFFGALFAAFFIVLATKGTSTTSWSVWLLLSVNTLLYPYSRFVYEGVVGFIMGENVFYVNAIFMLMVKLFTMSICWAAAVFVAPIGLAYLYYHHSKN